MAFCTVNIGMRRDEVGGVLWWHGMASCPTEFRGVGVIPPICAGNDENEYENPQGDIRKNEGPSRRLGGWEKELS
jgi:hypothetical protein